MSNDNTIIACEQAVRRFFQALDNQDFPTCASLMAPDGVWYRKGNPLVGRDAVRADLSVRGPEVVTAHLVTNCVVTPASTVAADVRYHALVYRCDNHVGPAGTPAPLGAPVSILFYEDLLVLLDGQ